MKSEGSKIVKASSAAVGKAAALIRGGGTVVFPTETVYGLGACALDAKAAARIFEIKKRPGFDPLIVHVSSIRQAKTLARIAPAAEALMARFWPGPLTLVLPKKKIVPDIVTAGLDTVALRMPAHPVALALIKKAGVPVAAPSANRFGSLSPTTAAHAHSQLKDGPDLILDGGPSRIGVESTVVAFTGGAFLILRHGGLPQEEIELVTGPLRAARKGGKRPVSPGQLLKHYSPRTPLRVVGRAPEKLKDGLTYGYLAFTASPALPAARVEILSRGGDLTEAAANLFSHLHKLDEAGVDLILAEAVPAKGLGRAIMDRLNRAASSKRMKAPAGRPRPNSRNGAFAKRRPPAAKRKDASL
ncbi:MAG: L-threonylcarbamoyladenylate synthase [Elusimicrobiales bacterium]|jgi:L-threonylcarbamoyladenylate synthase